MTGAIDALSLLRPFDAAGMQKVRIGAEGDGGYVMLDRFVPGQVLFSYGVGGDVSFDLALADRGVVPHLFDHTVHMPPSDDVRLIFHREGVGPHRDERQPVDTIGAHVVRHAGFNPDDLLLKIDVEAAEWVALMATPASVLARFEQIVVEWHAIEWLRHPAGVERIGGVWQKLAEHFRPIHVHGHNKFDFITIEGLPVPPILEVTYARRDLCEFRPSTQRFPVAGLDFPCEPSRAEHRLWMWPFTPD